MNLLKDKNIIVTGGSRGIGKSIVKKFLNNGANVVFSHYSSQEESDRTLSELKKISSNVACYKSDASNYESSQELVDCVIKDLGSVDVLVNNAGITKDNLLLRMSENDFQSVMEINMNSVFNLTKCVQRSMLKNRKGSIINMSSVVGVKGNAGQSNYSASKSAIIGFSKSIALELGSRNIRCNVIAPGFIETEMTEKLPDEVLNSWKQKIPLNRTGSTENISDVALFLASDMSSYVTGQVINVCGGMVT